MRRAVRSGLTTNPLRPGRPQPGLLGWLLRLSDLASTGFWSGAKCRRHGQIDLIAPRVPPHEPRERVLPARREILHFAKNGPPGKKFYVSPEIGTSPTLLIDWPSARERRSAKTPSARPHCCFLIGVARQKRAGVRYASLVHLGGASTGCCSTSTRPRHRGARIRCSLSGRTSPETAIAPPSPAMSMAYNIQGDATVSGAVPEPSTWAMLLLGFAGLCYAGYRQAKTSAAALLPSSTE